MEKFKLQELLSQMTLREKLGQLTQLYPPLLGVDPDVDITGPMEEMNIDPVWLPEIGSTLNAFGAENLITLQKRHMERSRLGIPLIFMADIVHGYKTIFPIPLAIGSSFNPELYETACSVAAREGAASGIHLTFAPMTDLVRDPRWGRVMESTGEDHYLNGEFTKAAVRGYQGDDFKEKGRLAACVKHFAAYGSPWGGRDYNTVDMSEGILREFYLPAYKAALDVGVAMVMTSFNTVNRIPASANKWLMRDILRKEWRFDGVVISDFAAVNETLLHGVCADGSEAARKCLEAGVDIEMMSTHYMRYAEDLVRTGKLDEALIDEATMRILELKNALGLFENPYKDASTEDEAALVQCDAHLQAAYDVAVECPVLLKNEDILPLQAFEKKLDKNLKIGLAGPFATLGNLSGGWAIAKADDDGTTSLLGALQSAMPNATIKTAATRYMGALQYGVEDMEYHPEELESLADCDVLIAAIGEPSADTGESASKTILRLSPNQEQLIRDLKKLGKPVVAVVFSGRPLEILPILDQTDAMLQAWFLGDASSRVLSDLLSGNANPSGRLSMSFPVNVGQIPVHYNAYNTGRPSLGKKIRYVSRYLDCENEALFPFGYGLSYSRFVYKDMAVEAVNDESNVVAKACITVENISDIAGKETVQLYIRDLVAQVVRPLKELRGFRKILLEAGQQQTVEFMITREMLSYWNAENNFIFEPGEFEIMLGRNSAETDSVTLSLA